MKIIILGAGHTGSSVAANLAKEGNDVVVVDINPARLRELQDSVDIATVVGSGTFPESLQRANTQDADLLISVLPRDEDNIVACQIAWALYQPPFIIARIRNIHYLDHPEIFTKDNIPIDALISPETLVTKYVQSLIQYPGVRQLHGFKNNSLKLVLLDVEADTHATNTTINALSLLLPEILWLGLLNDGVLVPISDRTSVLQADDQLLFLIPEEKLADAVALFQNEIKPYTRIIIAGGGHVGKRLAVRLQDNYKVKIIEKEPKRARCIAENLEKTMVLNADATDPDLLINEGISNSDVFCALTSSDEANILSSMMAKKLGVKETICLVNKTAYLDMILASAIDTVFSPEKITAASILRYVRRGGVINVCPLHGTSLEVVEIVVEGKQETSRVVGQQIAHLELPDEVMIGSIIRGDTPLSFDSQTVIETRDHLILVMPIKRSTEVEKYFQVVV